MKIFHISDLHIGKQLKMYDIGELQRSVFKRIAAEAERVRPDVIVIAGDIYDKAIPSGEAFHIFDEFLNLLSDIEPAIPTLIISGNHDNNLRLNYAASFLAKHKIYISASLPKTEDEHLQKIVLNDEYGEVNFYLLPFVRPADAKNLLKNISSTKEEEDKIRTYDDAVAFILSREAVDFSKRNVLVAHQFFVSGQSSPERRDSELQYISVGGIDSVSTEWVKQYDYVALGHIHSSQHIGEEHIRYSGTPLKYSLSEERDEKSITVVTLGEKGSPASYSYIPLEMKPDVRSVRGSFKEVWDMANEDNRRDYVSITLTDEDESALRDSKIRLGERYEHILDIMVDNSRTRAVLDKDLEDGFEGSEESPMVLFEAFYQEINGQPMSEQELRVMEEIMASVIAKEN